MIKHVPKSPWTPKTDEQREAIAVLRRKVAAAKRAKDRSDQANGEVWEAAEAARAVKVAATFIAKEIGPNRATLYRYVPAKATQEGGPSDE